MGDQAGQATLSGAQECWLDHLPIEVRAQIASQVSFVGYSRSTLHLAETSAELRDAVVAAFSNKVDLAPFVLEEPKRWSAVFDGKVREVTLKDSPPPFSLFRIVSHITALFNPQVLRRAEIPDEVPFLKAISGATQLHELKIIGMNGAACGAFDLAHSLKTLNLLKFELECRSVDHSTCPLHSSGAWMTLLESLANTCPILQSFARTSPCREVDDTVESNSLWKALSKLKSLRDVVIDQEPTTEACVTLRDLESVSLDNISRPDLVAQKLGSSVIGITAIAPLDARSIESLAPFFRLTKLHMTLQRNSGRAVLPLVQSLPGLRSLQLVGGRPRLVYGYTVPMPYASVPTGVLLEIVRNASKLEELDLLVLRINSTEVEEVLKCIGSRLRHFGMSLARQLKTPFEKLNIILFAMCRYNPNIVSLSLDNVLSDRSRNFSMEIFADEKRRLKLVLEQLQRRNPSCDMYEARDLVARAKAKHPNPTLAENTQALH